MKGSVIMKFKELKKYIELCKSLKISNQHLLELLTLEELSIYKSGGHD